MGFPIWVTGWFCCCLIQGICQKIHQHRPQIAKNCTCTSTPYCVPSSPAINRKSVCRPQHPHPKQHPEHAAVNPAKMHPQRHQQPRNQHPPVLQKCARTVTGTSDSTRSSNPKQHLHQQPKLHAPSHPAVNLANHFPVFIEVRTPIAFSYLRKNYTSIDPR